MLRKSDQLPKDGSTNFALQPSALGSRNLMFLIVVAVSDNIDYDLLENQIHVHSKIQVNQ